MKHITIFLLLALGSVVNVSAENALRSGRRQQLSSIDENSAGVEIRHSSDRRLFTWYSLLFLIGGPKFCDHARPKGGPMADAYDRKCKSSSEGSSNNDDGASDTNVSASMSSGSDNNNSNSGSALSSNSAISGATIWPMVAVAAAVVAAVVAFIVGRRRQAASNDHPLDGSVKRRMGIFSVFADKTISKSGDVELSSTPYTLA